MGGWVGAGRGLRQRLPGCCHEGQAGAVCLAAVNEVLRVYVALCVRVYWGHVSVSLRAMHVQAFVYGAWTCALDLDGLIELWPQLGLDAPMRVQSWRPIPYAHKH